MVARRKAERNGGTRPCPVLCLAVLGGDERTHFFPCDHAPDISPLVHVEDHHRQVVVLAKAHGGHVHHPQIALQNLHIADLIELHRVQVRDRVGAVDPFDLCCLHQHVGLDFHSTERGGGVGRKIRIAGTRGEDYHPALFQMANGAPPDIRLRHLVHFNRAHHAAMHILLLQRILHRQCVNDGSQHPHVIRRYAIHVARLLRHSAEKISSANHDCQLNAHRVNVCNLSGDLMNPRDIDAEAKIGRQRLPGKLKKNSFIHSYLSIADVGGGVEMQDRSSWGRPHPPRRANVYCLPMRKSVLVCPLLAGVGAAFLTIPLLSRAAAADSKAAPVLLVVNQGDKNISVVDPKAGRQVAVISEGVTAVHGHEVAASPDGRIAYVPIYGNVGVGNPGLNGHTMLVIDVPARKVIGNVDFGHGVRPHCVLYNRRDGLLYVTTELDNSVTIVDPTTLKIVGSIPTGQEQSHMLAISQDGRRGYTANVGPGTVSVLDIRARKTLAIIPVAAKVQRISVSNDGSMAFTSDQTKPQLAVIDTSTNKVKAWVPLPGLGYGSASTKDGRWLLVAVPDPAEVAVVDLRTLKMVRTIAVPSAPQEILVRPDGKVAYVSCNAKHQVAAIDLSRWKVEKLIDVGAGADGLAWAQ